MSGSSGSLASVLQQRAAPVRALPPQFRTPAMSVPGPSMSQPMQAQGMQPNPYQMLFRAMVPQIGRGSYPTMMSPFNPRTPNQTGILAPPRAPTNLSLGGGRTITPNMWNYLNNLPEHAMPGYSGE